MREKALRKKILEKYKSLREFANQINMPPTTLNSILNNIGGASIDKVLTICNALGIDIETLNPKITNPNLFPYTPTHRIPILGKISAGLPLFAEENIEGYTYTELNGSGEYFGLRVIGDSMNALRICEGDTVIIRKQPCVENGEIAVIMVDNDSATVKRFYQNENIVTLMPQSYNSEHQPQTYDLNKIDIKIIGKLVENKIRY